MRGISTARRDSFLSADDGGVSVAQADGKQSQAIALLIKDRATMKAVIIKDNKTTYDGVRFIFVKMFS